MNDLIDFTNCKNDRTARYGGSDQKRGVIYNNKRYMLKFADKIPEEKRMSLNSSYSNSVYSEHICCSILKNLGFPVQNTLLGTVDLLHDDGTIETKPVVACENFVPDGYELVHFRDIEDALLTEKPGKVPRLEDIHKIFYKENAYFTNDFGIKAAYHYYEEFVLDAFLGNFDRHANNWGYLVNKETGDISFAPIYDCGSCLYPQISDDSLNKIITNQEEIDKRIDKFPVAALIVSSGIKANYKEFLLATCNEECIKAIVNTVPKINWDIIDSTIDSMPISDIRKDFYKIMLSHRYEKILLPAYDRAISLVKDINSEQRKDKFSEELDIDENIDNEEDGFDPGDDD